MTSLQATALLMLLPSLLVLYSLRLRSAYHPLRSPTAIRTAVPTAARTPGPCPHILLISATRHGSTWLLDSTERCFYSRPPNATAISRVYSPDVFPSTELWNKRQPGRLSALSPRAAASHIARNGSVKLLPPLLHSRRTDVAALLREAKRLQLPVVLLRRRLDDAFSSLQDAARNGAWRLNTRGPRHRPRVTNGLEAYETDMEEYFREASELFREVGVEVDEVWYEHIVDEERIWFEHARCFVRNCNFD